jgi:hypothetical protein
MDAMHEALARLGVPAGATVLEPGSGIGNFMLEHHTFFPGERDCSGVSPLGQINSVEPALSTSED